MPGWKGDCMHVLEDRGRSASKRANTERERRTSGLPKPASTKEGAFPE